MKKTLTIILTLFVLFLTGCTKPVEQDIYVGQDGYLYINGEKTEIGGIGSTLEEFKITCYQNKGNVTGHIEMINGQLLLVVEYEEEVATKLGVLQEVAHEEITLYDMFVLNNYAPNNMDSLRSTNETYTDYAGTTTLQNKVYYTYNKAMYVEGTTSQQTASSQTYTGNYYIASKIKCTRYESGYLGIVFGTDSSQYVDTTVQEVTNDFITRSAIRTLSDARIFIGSCISANLDGYIDDTVVCDLSIFTEVPSKEKLDEIYERYLQIINGEIEESITYETVKKREVIYLGEHKEEFSDSKAKSVFMEYMNNKAKSIGMENTKFIDAAGFYNRTTAYDLLRMGVYACGYDPIVETWHKNEYSISVKGNIDRNVDITTTVKGAALEDYYFLFGGKTGTVDGQSNLLAVVEGPDERLFVVVVLGASVNRFEAAKQAMDVAVQKYNDPNFDASSVDVPAKSAAVCLVPKNNTLAYTDYPLTILYEKDIYTSRTPASITKVMTSMCMLDFVNDLNEEMVIASSDITAGSGNYFYAGDRISYKEALHAMLLPSSNTCAEAVATNVGHIMLEYENKNN